MEDLAQFAIQTMLKAGAEFADIRIERTNEMKLEIINGEVKTTTSALQKGAGLRAFTGGAWALTQTSDLTQKGILESGTEAVRIAKLISQYITEPYQIKSKSYQASVKHDSKIPLEDVSVEEKIQLLKELGTRSREHSNLVSRARAIYQEQITDLLVSNSLGTVVKMKLSLPLLKIFAHSKDGQRSHRGFKIIGGSGGFEVISGESAYDASEYASNLAVNLLTSKRASGGVQDIITDPDLTGVLAHESFGHACEADNWTAKSTILIDKFQKKLGVDDLTITDDPTRKGLRGSFEYDWEGTKSKRRVLIDQGVLNELLHSLSTASILDAEPNGAARAESFMFEPIPRMGNTFVEPGSWALDEMISDMKNGLLMCGVGGGYAISEKGQFMFRATHGYEVENGEIGQMIHGASIVGSHLDTLSKIETIGKDTELYPGTCGKGYQAVPDTSGGPHLLLRGMNVGGS